MNPLLVRPHRPATVQRRAQIAALMLAIVAAPAVASAQGDQTCENASARLTGHALPFVGSSSWNDWVTLTGCGTRGATIVSGLLQSRAVRDENELGRLDHLTGLLDGWFQPALISAYQGLARSQDASPAIRLRAMWLLAGLYAPSVEVASPLQNFSVTRCESTARSTALRDFPGVLPDGASDAALAAFSSAAADATAPERVRATARCWEGVMRDQLANAEQAVTTAQPAQPAYMPDSAVESTAPAPVERTVFYPAQQDVIIEQPIRVEYECGDRFVFYNEYGTDVAVQWASVGTRYGGVLRVTRGGPFVFAGARVGPIRFWVGEREVAYYQSWYRPCGSRVLLVGAPIYPWYGWRAGLGVVVWPVVRRPVYVAPRYIAPRVVPRYVPERAATPRYAVPAPPARRYDEPRRAPRPNDGARYETPRYGPYPATIPGTITRQEHGSVPTQRVATPHERSTPPQRVAPQQDRGSAPRAAQPRGSSHEESRGGKDGGSHGRRG